MLPQRLNHLRISRKKTHDDMAKLLGITRPAYTAYESGTRIPDNKKLEILADFFDVSFDYLHGRTEVLKESKAEHNIAFHGGGDDWTEEEQEIARYAAEAAVEAKRRREQKNK